MMIKGVAMLNKLRIFLLRTLLGWWMLPLLAVLMPPIIWLMSGSIDEVKYFLRVMYIILWKGYDDTETYM